MNRLPENILDLTMRIVRALEITGEDTLINLAIALDSLQHFPTIDATRANAIVHTASVALDSEEVIALAADAGLDMEQIRTDMLTLSSLFAEGT